MDFIFPGKLLLQKRLDSGANAKTQKHQFAATINLLLKHLQTLRRYGSTTGAYNTISKIVSVTVTFTGITANTAHIHKVGVAGGVVFAFNAPFTSFLNLTTAPLDAGQEADLYANMII